MSSSSPEQPNKVVLLGPEGVGKTSVIIRAKYNTFNPHPQPTIGATYTSICTDDDKILNIWDTAGQDRFESILPLYIRNSNCVVLCIDPDSSMHILNRFYSLVEIYAPDALVVICITKNDICLPPRILSDNIDLFVKGKNIRVFETSSFTGENISEMMEYIASEVYSDIESSRTKYGDKKGNVVITDEDRGLCLESVRSSGRCCF